MNQSLIATGVENHKLYATHSTVHDLASADEEAKCLKYTGSNYMNPVIDCCVGSRIMINENIATQLGLYNGAMGRIHSFGSVERDGKHSIEVIFVKMDEVYNGLTCDLSTTLPVSNLIPIVRMTSSTKINGKFFRRQFPISIAFARTVHSAQGITSVAGVVAYPQIRIFARGLEYVMISRATTMDNIILMSPLLPVHFNNRRYEKDREIIRNEYYRLVNLK